MWTVDDVVKAIKNVPFANSEEEWISLWVRPVTEFGLHIRLKPASIQERDWNFEDEIPFKVSLDQVQSSTQIEGVRLDVLAHYLTNSQEILWDKRGWFDNHYPVFILNDDGSYTVRDGTHRVVAEKMKGSEMILAHVRT